jgi:hypothetical protein
VNERGIAQVPELNAVPDFNLEQELASVAEFVLDSPVASDPQKRLSRRVTREELGAMTAHSAGAATSHDEHDE